MSANTLDFCANLSDEDDRRARELLERATAKWPLRALHILSEENGPLRFSRLLERMDGVSQKVLTQTLRTLERDGLVIRTLYPQVPPKVEYELTELGNEVLVRVVSLWEFIVVQLPRFDVGKARSLHKPSVSEL